jgi:hypothetical protein
VSGGFAKRDEPGAPKQLRLKHRDIGEGHRRPYGQLRIVPLRD